MPLHSVIKKWPRPGSAYDSHPVGAGRIVAHTTWHHFVNVNLNGFWGPGDSKTDAFGTLAMYYVNLASYLMPVRKRKQALNRFLQTVVQTPNMRDLHQAPIALIGQAAYLHFREIATAGQIHDLVNIAVEEIIPPKKDNASSQLFLPDIKYLLGGMVAEQQKNLKFEEPGKEVENDHSMKIAARGIKLAINTRLSEIEEEEKLKSLLG